MNSIWGPSLSIFEIEYNLVYATILSILFSFCIVLTGYFSRNKYALLASIRAGLLVLNLELFLGLMVLNLVVLSESFCLSVFVIYQEVFWFIFLFFMVSGFIMITFLLEVNRAPFDLAEAESELITGYSVEIGGFFFALYYLGEYFHLFFFSSFIAILFFCGWETPEFLGYLFQSKYSLDHVNFTALEAATYFTKNFYLFVAKEIAEWTVVANIHNTYSSIILNKIFGLSESFEFMLYYYRSQN